ncbi:MAG: class I SAM-dependent methyltransferase [Myxococcales bacterium]|nr:class I SAM-dependent methyltransferase [Myxococcales bacterium]
MLRTPRLLPAIAALSLCGACNTATVTPDEALPAEPPAVMAEVVPDVEVVKEVEVDPIDAILAADFRAESRARDGARHPKETLQFFGVTRSSTVVELWPGGGWYTEILAPLVRDEGKLIVTNYDPKGPAKYYGTKGAATFAAKLAAAPERYDRVEVVRVTQDVKLDKKGEVKSIAIKPFPLAAPGSVDVVLTFRNVHGWYEHKQLAKVLEMAYLALREGGVLGIVAHRAAQGADPVETAPLGYLPEEAVIEAAQAAGFTLAGRAEINANPRDTKDYKQGVWTLPPRLIEGDKDRERYLEIGESDRMTLKFVKPAK